MPTTKTPLLLHAVGEAEKHRSWVTVIENADISEHLAIQFSTTFEQSKNPDYHRVQHVMQITNRDDLERLILFLAKYL